MKPDHKWIVRAAQDRAKGDPKMDVDDEPEIIGSAIPGAHWVAAWVLVTPEDAEAAEVSHAERTAERLFRQEHSA